MNFWIRLNMFCRSFFLQAGWNYVKYQNLGFTFVMLPFLRHLYKKDPTVFSTVLQRYLDTFNTHPVMASFCYGAMAQQEEIIAKTQSVADYKEKVQDWTETRRALSITAASIGDRLFWGTIKPLTLLLAIFIWMLMGVNFFEIQYSSQPTAWILWLVPLGAFIVYNLLTWLVRWQGIKVSYSSDISSCFGLTYFDWNKTIYYLKQLGVILSALLIIFAFGLYLTTMEQFDVHFIAHTILIAFFVLFSFVTHRFKIPNVYLYLITVFVFSMVCLF